MQFEAVMVSQIGQTACNQPSHQSLMIQTYLSRQNRWLASQRIVLPNFDMPRWCSNKLEVGKCIYNCACEIVRF
jgi:hypothetical protein